MRHMTDKEILIVKCKAILNKKQFDDLYEGIVNMKSHGVVLLPPYCDAIIVPDDVTIKLDTVKNNGHNYVQKAYDILASYMAGSERNEAYAIETALGYLGEELE